ncbi:hypothetical protein BDZ89DRAFT_1063042 [Hymenopellis radicata]|nr:hypothetical protein BDZ89DRAFT_1063042 [Hymenopellis radicata]
MTTDTRPFPDMPIDILREVVGFAASSNIQSALSLTLVSSYTRQWTLPLLYHTVHLSSSRAVSKFCETLSHTNTGPERLTPSIPLHRRVKNLAIFALGPMDRIHRILSTCTNVQSLACGFSVQHIGSQLVSPARELHLLGMSCRDGIPFTAIPMTTTHLHVQLSLDTLAYMNCANDHLPELTHLALSVPITHVKSLGMVLSVVERILENCSEIQLLHLQVMGSKSGELVDTIEQSQKRDSRFIVSRALGALSRQWMEARSLPFGVWPAASHP